MKKYKITIHFVSGETFALNDVTEDVVFDMQRSMEDDEIELMGMGEQNRVVMVCDKITFWTIGEIKEEN